MKIKKLLGVSALLCSGMSIARADVVTDWNLKAAQITLDARLGAPDATEVIATTEVAVSDALTAITGKYTPLFVELSPFPKASVEATVAAASHAVLLKMVPGQQPGIDAAYETSLAKIPDSDAKKFGINLGTLAAEAVLRARAGTIAPESYRPVTAPGQYVPTTIPAGLTVSQRKLWVLASCDQFRPGPPPALESALWARDYNEIKALGARTGSQRTLEQTQIASFWEAVNPILYVRIAQSVANMPGHDPALNARLLAVVAMVGDDALTAVFDAKYTYNFWRPVTAIRNGDRDGNDATERDASWLPFIDTPMHPEYPCAHCVSSAAVGAVLKAALEGTPSPTLVSSSPTAPGKTRSWANPEGFMQEVALARIYDGVHYRNSTEIGSAMGVKIGELAATKYLGQQFLAVGSR
jgi:hypothetical protein